MCHMKFYLRLTLFLCVIVFYCNFVFLYNVVSGSGPFFINT